MSENLSPEAWQSIEEDVDKAEIAQRQAQKSSQKLYRQTGLTKGEREDLGKKEIVEKSKIPRVAEKAIDREKNFAFEAEALLGKNGGKLQESLIGLRRENLINALRTERRLERNAESKLQEETAVLKTIDQAGVPDGSDLEALDEIRGEIEGLNTEKEELLNSSPEAYYGLHLKELKEYSQEFSRGRIVETDYVQTRAQDIATHLRAGVPTMIYGHLGSGKTELAMHVAREYIGKDALVISGSKHTSLAELYGHQILSLEGSNKEEVNQYQKEVEAQYDRWVAEHEESLERMAPEDREAEKNRAHDRVLQTYLTQFKGGTVSNFFLGPVYRAMAEGQPVIIDEVNAIPHEVLISLNHILTRRVGEKINVQQDSGEEVTVQDGFGIIMTGNLNQGQERYIDRQDMDPAFLSRLYKLEYDYLPQAVEGGIEEAGKQNELFEIVLAKLMDKNGNLEIPEDSVSKLWHLAQAARVTQNVFSGREVDNAFYFQEAGGRPVKYLLKEGVLSIRALDNVLTAWQKEGFRQELDHYLYKEFISQSTVASDRAYFYQLFKDRFGFFQGEGWQQNPNYGTSGVINAFNVEVPENPAAKIGFFGPRQTVSFVYGKAPERAKWPEAEGVTLEEKPEQQDVEELMRLEQWRGGLDMKINEIRQEIEASKKPETK